MDVRKVALAERCPTEVSAMEERRLPRAVQPSDLRPDARYATFMATLPQSVRARTATQSAKAAYVTARCYR